MLIGEVSKQSGCHIETIRYYERIALLAPTARTEAGYRLYREQHIQQLRFIHRARELGFSLDDIRELMSLKSQPQLPCQSVEAITEKHLQGIQQRIEHLNSMAQELRHVAASCSGGDIAECRILGALANPANAHDGNVP